MEVRHVPVTTSAVATRLGRTLRITHLPSVGTPLRTAVVGATDPRDRAHHRVGPSPALAASIDSRCHVVCGGHHRCGTGDLSRDDLAAWCVVPSDLISVDGAV